MSISIIVPLYNERQNVARLLQNVEEALTPIGEEFELILIDDGSTDGTYDLLSELLAKYPFIKIIQFRKNFGQTAAMSAGFDYAKGDVVIPMDGDLQNDPADIPRLIDKLNEGFDVVSGWRKNRKDHLITRKVPSWIANYVIGKITKIRLHDYGCTLKAYRREVVKNMNLYGEMHRFLPALASWYGASVTELEVHHHPRRHGQSKYGLSRTLKVVLDLITVKFLGEFSTKPLHIFGGMGIITFLGAILSGGAVIYQKFFSDLSMNRNPLLILTTLLIIMSVQFLLMGLLAEMQARTYHESQHKPTYVIRRILDAHGLHGESNPSGDQNDVQ